MPGELWTGKLQIGKETTAGTPVAATRKLYAIDPKLDRTRVARPRKFATGTRDNVRALTLGPAQAAGQIVIPMSADELIEMLLMGVQGGVTPVVATGVSTWTFKPGASLDSATVEWLDGANPWQEAGVRVDKIGIKGSVDGDNVVTSDLFGMALVANALTGSLTDRVPTYIEGWETKLYIDAAGGTPGTTNIPGTMINWDVTLNNNLGRKFFADDVNKTGAVVVGEIGVTAKFLFEAAPSTTLTEFNNWDAATRRIVRLQFGKNTTIPTTAGKYEVDVDIPGAWSAVLLGQSDKGTRAYEFSLDYVYDTTLAAGLVVTAINGRATAY